MNFRTTIVLIALLAVVGLYLLLTRSSDTETETTPADERKLISAESADITRVAIAPAGGTRVVVEKKPDGNWRITEPVQAPADRYEVDNIVTSATALTSRGKVGSEDVANTGLDQPRFVVELTAKDGKSHKLAIGERSAVGDHMYVRIDDDERPDVVSADMYDSLEEPLKKLRETKLADVTSTEIRQIEIRDGEKTLRLHKAGENWQIVEPKPMPADSSAVSDLTYGIAGLNAVEFVTEDPAQASNYGLNEPVLSVWYSTQAPATQPSTGPAATAPAGTTIQFGRYEDILRKNVFARVSSSPSIATVSATALETFRKTPLELRDKNVVQIDPQTVTMIALRADVPATTQPTTREAVQREIVLQRQRGDVASAQSPTTAPATTMSAATTQAATTEPTTTEAEAAPKPNWIFASMPDQTVDESKVDALLTALNPLRAEEFLETAPTTQPTGTYVLTVTAESPGRKEVTEIRITDPGNNQPLIGAYNDLTFELNRSLLSQLETDFVASASGAAAAPATVPPVPMMP